MGNISITMTKTQSDEINNNFINKQEQNEYVGVETSITNKPSMSEPKKICSNKNLLNVGMKSKLSKKNLYYEMNGSDENSLTIIKKFNNELLDEELIDSCLSKIFFMKSLNRKSR